MPPHSLRSLLLPFVVLALFIGCRPSITAPEPRSAKVLRLAVTTSTRDSGLLEALNPVFEQQHRARVDVIAVGTGAALKLGEAGDVDIVLVHARAAEDAFMAAGHGIRREDVMYNTFEILGPPSDPAGIRDMKPAEAMRKIATSSANFVSRGDDSGTHKRELQLWDTAGGLTPWDTYIESGQGMGASLTMADQMNAYVLTDHGTYLKFKNKIDLVPLVDSGESLRNPYGIMVVNPDKHESLDRDLAEAYVDFIVSAETQQLIADYRIEGEQLFVPLRLPKSK